MLQIKSKTMLMFLLSLIALAGIGFYFYNSLQSLNERVETSINPQKRSNYLKTIALDLNRLNNLYLVDSIKFSPQRVDTIINNIESNLEWIEDDFKVGQDPQYEKLDTIPKLLRQIQAEYLSLEEIREESRERYVSDLENVLKEELSKLNLSTKDSVTIIRQITAEISRNETLKTDTENIEDTENLNFFQRLFGASRKEKENHSQDTVPAVRSQSQPNTVISESIDTLVRANGSELSEIKIISIFEKIQRSRLAITENLNDRERQIFQKNAEINNYIEGVLNEILFEELHDFDTYVNEFSQASRNYILEIGAILIVFVVLGFIAILVIFKDVNKGIFYQKKLKQGEERALREAEEKQKFLSTMSHELRTPLTSIIGYADMLDQEDENVQALRSASNYLYQMTNEILDMAKIKAGIIEIKQENFDLLEVLKKIKDNFEALILQEGIQPVFNYPENPVYIISDEYRIQQIIYNLVHNAVKYTEEGFIKVGLETIESTEKEDHLDVTIVIEDSGIGMNKAEQKSIFEDYQQAGTHKNKIKGTGLGLGIVQRVVTEMGGSLALESEEGKGSKFRIGFSFPKGTKKKVIRNTPYDLPHNVFEGIQIFAVDDDPLITRLYDKILTPYGASFYSLNSPQEAYEHLKDHTYDVVIFDMKMPGLSGYQLKEKLKDEGVALGNTLIATANVMLSDEDKRNLESFDNRLFKPLRKSEVLKAIAKLLDIHPERDTNATFADVEKAIVADVSKTFNNQKPYDFNELKEYTGDDEKELKEMLQYLTDENTQELKIYKQALNDKDLETLANTIHKLSSRYGQLNVEPPFDTKKLELGLRDRKEDTIPVACKLYDFWKEVNEAVQQDIQSM